MRKGLIIAAGNGSRLRTDEDDLPKPLIKVAGVPLIERVILTAKKAGLSHFVVVLGFRGEAIEKYLQTHQKRLGVSVEFVWNEDWKKPNGFSVLKAEPLIEDEFVLMMSDHIVEVKMLEEFLQRGVVPGEVTLGTDARIGEIFDLDDATRVLATDGRIVEIGKNIENYNCIDTGLFLCSSGLFEALREVTQTGTGSLSEAIRWLAQRGRARAMPMGDYFWQDVDSPETLVYAEQRLFQLLTKPTDGFVSRFFNRKVSGWISRRLIKLPISANQVTYSALFFGLLSAYLVARGDHLSVALGGILFQFCSIYDGCDGEIAKLRMTSSRFGEWLDTVCDNITYIAFFIGIVVGLHRQEAAPFLLYLGVVSLGGVIFTLILMYSYLRRYSQSGSLVTLQTDYSNEVKTSSSIFSRVIDRLKPLGKRDFFALLFMMFALFNRLDLILIATFIGSQLMWIVLLGMKKGVSDALAPVHDFQED